MRTPAIALALLIAAAFAARPALAQTAEEKPGVSPISGASAQTEIDQQPPPKPPPPKPQPKPTIPSRKPKPGVGAFVLFDNEWMTAKDTFDAVFDKSTFTFPGIGGEAFNLFGGLFARVTYGKTTENGTRVAVVDGEALPLNIPLELELSTTEVAGGWRVPFGQPRRTGVPAVLRAPRLHAYGGGGFLFVSYRESSSFAETGDDSRESFIGYTVFGGVDVTIWKLIYAGAEAQFRIVPDALGEGGASREFEETDLGGVVVRVLFGVRK